MPPASPLVARLAPDAVLVGDGGGKARSIPRPMVGAVPIARAFVAFSMTGAEMGATLEAALVNGRPGFRARDPEGRILNVASVDIADGVVQRIHSMLNPDKLGHLGPVSDLGLRPGVR